MSLLGFFRNALLSGLRAGDRPRKKGSETVRSANKPPSLKAAKETKTGDKNADEPERNTTPLLLRVSQLHPMTENRIANEVAHAATNPP